MNSKTQPSSRKVRYAVVGLGWIAQESVLPAFAHAANSELAALVSDDPVKLKALSRTYGVSSVYSYEEYDACLKSGGIDAVYIALPNHMHCEYTVRAAEKGIHVLCEKPMAITEAECRWMIRAAHENDVRLMIAYRLHFDEASIKALRIARSGRLGELRCFHSYFSTPVKDEDNIRLKPEKGGGTLYDIGIYCLNAARSVFSAEPISAFAQGIHGNSHRFHKTDEMTSFTLTFPGNRLCTFTVGFEADSASVYRIAGSHGNLVVEPAYAHEGPLKHALTIDGKTRKKTFSDRDQFAPELLHFSDCVLRGKSPGPSGEEGLADVRVICALHESMAKGHPVALKPVKHHPAVPSSRVPVYRPAPSKPRLVHAAPPGDK